MQRLQVLTRLNAVNIQIHFMLWSVIESVITLTFHSHKRLRWPSDDTNHHSTFRPKSAGVTSLSKSNIVEILLLTKKKKGILFDCDLCYCGWQVHSFFRIPESATLGIGSLKRTLSIQTRNSTRQKIKQNIFIQNIVKVRIVNVCGSVVKSVCHCCFDLVLMRAQRNAQQNKISI